MAGRVGDDEAPRFVDRHPQVGRLARPDPLDEPFAVLVEGPREPRDRECRFAEPYTTPHQHRGRVTQYCAIAGARRSTTGSNHLGRDPGPRRLAPIKDLELRGDVVAARTALGYDDEPAPWREGEAAETHGQTIVIHPDNGDRHRRGRQPAQDHAILIALPRRCLPGELASHLE